MVPAVGRRPARRLSGLDIHVGRVLRLGSVSQAGSTRSSGYTLTEPSPRSRSHGKLRHKVRTVLCAKGFRRTVRKRVKRYLGERFSLAGFSVDATVVAGLSAPTD
jgi:hypothetical protein